MAAGKLERPFPARDRAIFELLYGCGLRVSELVGLNLEDLDRAERWMRVRGKGRKERQVPMPGKAADALERYLARAAGGARRDRRVPEPSRRAPHRPRHPRHREALRHAALAATPRMHPHSFRHAYATHLLADGADLRAIQELLGHARLSTTQKYTQVALTDLMAVYDKAHPKA